MSRDRQADRGRDGQADRGSRGRRRGRHPATDETSCFGGAGTGNAHSTAARSASSSGSAATSPPSSPAFARICRYRRSVFGPIPSSFAICRAGRPIRCNRTSSCNRCMSLLWALMHQAACAPGVAIQKTMSIRRSACPSRIAIRLPVPAVSPPDQSDVPASHPAAAPSAGRPLALPPPIRLPVPNAIRLPVPVSDPLGRPGCDPLPRSLTRPKCGRRAECRRMRGRCCVDEWPPSPHIGWWSGLRSNNRAEAPLPAANCGVRGGPVVWHRRCNGRCRHTGPSAPTSAKAEFVTGTESTP